MISPHFRFYFHVHCLFLQLPPITAKMIPAILEEFSINLWAERQRSVTTHYCSVNTGIDLDYSRMPSRDQASQAEIAGHKPCAVPIELHILKDYQQRRTLCLYRDTASSNIFDQDFALEVDDLKVTQDQLYQTVRPVLGFIPAEPNSLVKGYILDKHFYGTIRMYDKFRLYHVVFYIEPPSNIRLYSEKYVAEPVATKAEQNAILFEHVSNIPNAKWLHCDNDLNSNDNQTSDMYKVSQDARLTKLPPITAASGNGNDLSNVPAMPGPKTTRAPRISSRPGKHSNEADDSEATAANKTAPRQQASIRPTRSYQLGSPSETNNTGEIVSGLNTQQPKIRNDTESNKYSLAPPQKNPTTRAYEYEYYYDNRSSTVRKRRKTERPEIYEASKNVSVITKMVTAQPFNGIESNHTNMTRSTVDHLRGNITVTPFGALNLTRTINATEGFTKRRRKPSHRTGGTGQNEYYDESSTKSLAHTSTIHENASSKLVHSTIFETATTLATTPITQPFHSTVFHTTITTTTTPITLPFHSTIRQTTSTAPTTSVSPLIHSTQVSNSTTAVPTTTTSAVFHSTAPTNVPTEGPPIHSTNPTVATVLSHESPLHSTPGPEFIWYHSTDRSPRSKATSVFYHSTQLSPQNFFTYHSTDAPTPAKAGLPTLSSIQSVYHSTEVPTPTLPKNFAHSTEATPEPALHHSTVEASNLEPNTTVPFHSTDFQKSPPNSTSGSTRDVAIDLSFSTEVFPTGITFLNESGSNARPDNASMETTTTTPFLASTEVVDVSFKFYHSTESENFHVDVGRGVRVVDENQTDAVPGPVVADKNDTHIKINATGDFSSKFSGSVLNTFVSIHLPDGTVVGNGTIIWTAPGGIVVAIKQMDDLAAVFSTPPFHSTQATGPPYHSTDDATPVTMDGSLATGNESNYNISMMMLSHSTELPFPPIHSTDLSELLQENTTALRFENLTLSPGGNFTNVTSSGIDRNASAGRPSFGYYHSTAATIPPVHSTEVAPQDKSKNVTAGFTNATTYAPLKSRTKYPRTTVSVTAVYHSTEATTAVVHSTAITRETFLPTLEPMALNGGDGAAGEKTSTRAPATSKLPQTRASQTGLGHSTEVVPPPYHSTERPQGSLEPEIQPIEVEPDTPVLIQLMNGTNITVGTVLDGNKTHMAISTPTQLEPWIVGHEVTVVNPEGEPLHGKVVAVNGTEVTIISTPVAGSHVEVRDTQGNLLAHGTIASQNATHLALLAPIPTKHVGEKVSVQGPNGTIFHGTVTSTTGNTTIIKGHGEEPPAGEPVVIENSNNEPILNATIVFENDTTLIMRPNDPSVGSEANFPNGSTTQTTYIPTVPTTPATESLVVGTPVVIRGKNGTILNGTVVAINGSDIIVAVIRPQPVTEPPTTKVSPSPWSPVGEHVQLFPPNSNPVAGTIVNDANSSAQVLFPEDPTAVEGLTAVMLQYPNGTNATVDIIDSNRTAALIVPHSILPTSPAALIVPQSFSPISPAALIVPQSISPISPAAHNISQPVLPNSLAPQSISQPVSPTSSSVQSVNQPLPSNSPAVQNISESVASNLPGAHNISQQVSPTSPAFQHVDHSVSLNSPSAEIATQSILPTSPVQQNLNQSLPPTAEIVLQAIPPTPSFPLYNDSAVVTIELGPDLIPINATVMGYPYNDTDTAIIAVPGANLNDSLVGNELIFQNFTWIVVEVAGPNLTLENTGKFYVPTRPPQNPLLPESTTPHHSTDPFITQRLELHSTDPGPVQSLNFSFYGSTEILVPYHSTDGNPEMTAVSFYGSTEVVALNPTESPPSTVESPPTRRLQNSTRHSPRPTTKIVKNDNGSSSTSTNSSMDFFTSTDVMTFLFSTEVFPSSTTTAPWVFTNTTQRGTSQNSTNVSLGPKITKQGTSLAAVSKSVTPKSATRTKDPKKETSLPVVSIATTPKPTTRIKTTKKTSLFRFVGSTEYRDPSATTVQTLPSNFFPSTEALVKVSQSTTRTSSAPTVRSTPKRLQRSNGTTRWVTIHSTEMYPLNHSTAVPTEKAPTTQTAAESAPSNNARRRRRRDALFNFNQFFGENAIESELDEDVAEDLPYSVGFTDSDLFDTRIEKTSICSLCIWIQPHFAESFGLGGGLFHGVAEVVDILKMTDWVFRAIDFNQDGIPENIGFKIRRLILKEKENMFGTGKGDHNATRRKRAVYTRRKVYPSNIDHQLSAVDPRIKERFKRQDYFEDYYEEFNDVDGKKRKKSRLRANVFSREPKSLSPKSALLMATEDLQATFPDCCAILGFIYHDLGPTIATTNKRALCSSKNVALVSGYAFKRKLTKYDVFRGVVHALGHLFGASHDVFSDVECWDRQLYDFLNPFASHPVQQTNVGLRPNSFKFSSCAKDHITMFLSSNGPDCLTKETDEFCGNGILEGDEICDCGSMWQCHLSFPCCGERDTISGCQIINPAKRTCHRPTVW